MSIEQQEIKKEQFDECRDALRNFSKEWSKEISEAIKKDEQVPKNMRDEVSPTKVYNVFYNVVKHKLWRLVIYNAALDLLKNKQETFQKGMAAVQSKESAVLPGIDIEKKTKVVTAALV